VPNNASTATTVTPVDVATLTPGAPINVGSTQPFQVQIVGGSASVADLTLTGSVSPPTLQVGSNVPYTVTATNAGPNVSTGTTITDALPPGVTFVSATASQGSCAQASGTVTCSLGGLAVGGSATATVVVRPTGAAGASIVNMLTAGGNETDTDGT